MKRLAVISFTKQSGELARQLEQTLLRAGEQIAVTRYCFSSYAVEGAIPFQDAAVLVKALVGDYDGILFICAAGIAVRLMAPHLVHKLVDPAVLVMDEAGQFVISLLSGHVGGANAYAQQLAAAIGAVPVITTATDIHHRFSPDVLARENHLYITDLQMSKQLSAAIAAGKQVGLYCELPLQQVPKEVVCVKTKEQAAGLEYGICIAREPVVWFRHTLHLLPQCYIIGAGCRKDTEPARFARVIAQQLAANHVDWRMVRALASVDIKQKEPAMLAFAKQYDIPFYTYSAQQLMAVQGIFQTSAFVEQVTGADNICERSAMVEADRLVAGKYSQDGVTVALSYVEMQVCF